MTSDSRVRGRDSRQGHGRQYHDWLDDDGDLMDWASCVNLGFLPICILNVVCLKRCFKGTVCRLGFGQLPEDVPAYEREERARDAVWVRSNSQPPHLSGQRDPTPAAVRVSGPRKGKGGKEQEKGHGQRQGKDPGPTEVAPCTATWWDSQHREPWL